MLSLRLYILAVEVVVLGYMPFHDNFSHLWSFAIGAFIGRDNESNGGQTSGEAPRDSPRGVGRSAG